MQTIIKRLLLLLAFVGMASVAQEPATEAAQAAEIDELEPGVSSEDLSTIGEEEESAAPTAVLAQDVRRREVNNGALF